MIVATEAWCQALVEDLRNDTEGGVRVFALVEAPTSMRRMKVCVQRLPKPGDAALLFGALFTTDRNEDVAEFVRVAGRFRQSEAELGALRAIITQSGPPPTSGFIDVTCAVIDDFDTCEASRFDYCMAWVNVYSSKDQADLTTLDYLHAGSVFQCVAVHSVGKQRISAGEVAVDYLRRGGDADAAHHAEIWLAAERMVQAKSRP